MPGFVASIHDFHVQVMCAMHRERVVGAVLELNADRGKCLESRNDKCSSWWYVEGTYKEFQLPEDSHVDDHPPTG